MPRQAFEMSGDDRTVDRSDDGDDGTVNVVSLRCDAATDRGVYISRSASSMLQPSEFCRRTACKLGCQMKDGTHD